MRAGAEAFSKVMKNRQEKHLTGSDVGRIYDEKWMPPDSPFEANERESVFETLVVKDRLLLDLGAGTLRFTLAAIQKGAKQVVAVEMLKGMLTWGLKKARSYREAQGKIDVIIADVRYLPLIANTFDAAVAVELFEHIPNNVELLVKEVHRVLKHSGKATINTWNGIPRRLMSLSRTDGKDLEFWIGVFYYRYYYPWEFKRLLRSANFSKVKVYGAYSVNLLPYLRSKVSLDPPKGSFGVAFDKVFRKLKLVNQITGKFLMARVQK